MERYVTKEPQNQVQIENYRQQGPATMGPWTSHIWRTDPRHLLFVLARYKFCAKMLQGKARVLEIGCGDAFGTALVLQTVDSVHGIDIEPIIVAEAEKNLPQVFSARATFAVHDMVRAPTHEKFDAAYSLDVIEHIPASAERMFIANICASLKPDALCILGTPNITAQQYASPASAEGHVNLKSAETLERLLLDRFHNAFVLSMNDEVVHTGYHPMAHYLLGVGIGVKG